MKEEAWKKSSRSRIPTKEAFKIKKDCLMQFLGLVYDHPVWYIYIYMIYVDVLICMCTICTSLYKWDLLIKYPHFENFKFENVKY